MMKTKPNSAFPLAIEKGGIKVKIYQSRDSKPRYTVAYYLGGQRKRATYSNLPKAELEAQAVLAKLLNGESEALRLVGKDRVVYVHAKERLAEVAPRLSLLEMVEEYVQAKALLPAGTSLRETAKEWVDIHQFPEMTVGQILDELVDSKKKAGLSSIYIKDFDRLKPFAKAFQTPVINIKPAQIEAYLLSLKNAPRTRNNVRRLIGGLFRFAVKRGYLPKSHDVLSGVEKAKVVDKEVEVFTPEELGMLFGHAREEMIPYLAIAAFAGLRKAEIERLDWSEVNLAEGYIKVPAVKAKTASRRIVPVTENLHNWLTPYNQDSGPIVPFANVSKQLTEVLSRASGIKWKQNGLRHSFISYRLAEIKDLPRVALEAGNSPDMIIKHYRELVTESQANAWFNISPVELPEAESSAVLQVSA